MKKIFNIIIAGVTVASTAMSCTGAFEDINRNPYEPSDLTADGYLMVSAMSNVAGTVIPADVNCNQFTDCLLGGTQGGYFSDGANFTTSIARYCAPDNWTGVFLSDQKIIPTLYSNIAIIKGYCERTGTHVPVAIANITKVATMSRVTDCYGPIPYTGIGSDGDIVTPYDSQQEVYHAFFDDLDDAINDLRTYSSETMIATADAVYRGDISKWIKFGNSLKLRLALRIAYAEPTLAKQMAEEAINPANGGVIESNSENAAWNYFSTSTNPMYTATRYNLHDSRAAADIICYMNGFNDPRRAEYFDGCQWPGVDYAGIRRGWSTFSTTWSVNFCDIKMSANEPLMWLNAAEVAFLRAEGAAIFNWSMGGTAESFYNKGIELSFDQYGVSGAAEYMADATSVPAAYDDPSGVNPWTGSLPAVTIKWDESASTETKQEKIIVQKWIANYKLGNEAWADIRRTGYPKLIPVAYNGSGGIVDSNRGPERMVYPQSEYSNNGANLQAAITNYLKGPDNMATKVWWACKPGL
jgi:hypothetical protein